MLRVLPTIRLLDVDGEVGGEQEERTVRHVDGAHEPEDQGEARRNDEQQAGEGEAVEHRDDELARFADGRTGRRVCGPRPVGDEQHPEQGERDEQRR